MVDRSKMMEGRMLSPDPMNLGFATRAIYQDPNPAGALTSSLEFICLDGRRTVSGASPSVGTMWHEAAQSHATEALERRLASLEGAEAGLVLSSGIVAFTTLVLSLLSKEEELIVPNSPYFRTLAMVQPSLGIKIVPVDLSDPGKVVEAISERLS